MASIYILLLVFLAGASASSNNKIVGGNPTTIEKYPWVVQVDITGFFINFWYQGCAANILTTRYVLSAAHCFHGILYLPQFRRIRAGSTYSEKGGFVSYVEREFNHPSYGLLGYDGDITVVRLITPLVYSPVIQPGTIVAQGTNIPDNIPVVYVGWGAIAQNGAPSDVLRDVTVYTINNEFCAQRYLELPRPGLVTPNMICAGLIGVGGQDACQGDSGGPMYFGNIIVGVVSWGYGCANETFPGVSTAVSSYTNWIVSVAV